MEDFQVEMKWECDSAIIPFIKHLTPNDTYVISKKGCSLRIDATLLSWDKLQSKRGNFSLIYRGDYDGELIFVDHETNEVSDFFQIFNIDEIDEIAKEMCENKEVSSHLHIEGL